MANGYDIAVRPKKKTEGDGTIGANLGLVLVYELAQGDRPEKNCLSHWTYVMEIELQPANLYLSLKWSSQLTEFQGKGSAFF
jgi:hypothetical protein